MKSYVAFLIFDTDMRGELGGEERQRQLRVGKSVVRACVRACACRRTIIFPSIRMSVCSNSHTCTLTLLWRKRKIRFCVFLMRVCGPRVRTCVHRWCSVIATATE